MLTASLERKLSNNSAGTTGSLLWINSRGEIAILDIFFHNFLTTNIRHQFLHSLRSCQNSRSTTDCEKNKNILSVTAILPLFLHL